MTLFFWKNENKADKLVLGPSNWLNSLVMCNVISFLADIDVCYSDLGL